LLQKHIGNTCQGPGKMVDKATHASFLLLEQAPPVEEEDNCAGDVSGLGDAMVYVQCAMRCFSMVLRRRSAHEENEFLAWMGLMFFLCRPACQTSEEGWGQDLFEQKHNALLQLAPAKREIATESMEQCGAGGFAPVKREIDLLGQTHNALLQLAPVKREIAMESLEQYEADTVRLEEGFTTLHMACQRIPGLRNALLYEIAHMMGRLEHNRNEWQGQAMLRREERVGREHHKK
jgi:hypothetical protein